jgi:predicted HicB family RNase H-like nuclease
MEDKPKRYALNISQDLHTRFKVAAAANHETMNAVLSRCIESYVLEYEEHLRQKEK